MDNNMYGIVDDKLTMSYDEMNYDILFKSIRSVVYCLWV